MINKIIDFSINNKFIIGLFTLSIIIAGIWSMTKVPIDAVPDITNNQVQVITQAPNLGAEDIEQLITYPVELTLSNLPDVEEIRSVSRFGLSVVTIVFNDDIGTYLPRQLVAEKIPEIQEQIPEGFGKPFIGPISTGLSEIYQYTLDVDPTHKDQYSATDLRTFQDWIVRRQMAMVPGIVEVNAFGGYKKQYQVSINPEKLRAINLSIVDVFKALENNNQNTGGAYIEKNHQANFIRGEGLVRDLTDIEQIVVKTINNIPVTIKDIAQVKIDHAVRYGALTKDGKGETVGGMILMLKDANSNQVIEQVKERMTQIQKSLPDGVKINPFLDRSELIAKTTNTVTTNLIEGALIVIFVLVILLGNWRGGLIVASTIPLALLVAFILMHVFDVWANLMSLGAIDFGIIVDGAVIIVESAVFLLMKQLSKQPKIDQAKRNEIVSKSSKKMMNAAFFGQLIILIVFIPILALEGVEGKMFKPMALTFIFAMIGAMVLCLTYVPMVSSLFLKVPKDKQPSWGDRFIRWIENKYKLLLNKVLHKPAIILGSALIALVLSVVTYSRLGGEFIPQLDEGDIAFHAILKPGSALSESIETTTKIEQLIKAEFPEAISVISRIGVADVPTDPMPMDMADVFIILKPKKEWTSASSKEELIHKIKKTIGILPGVNYEFTQPIEMRFNELLTGVREDVAIKLFGDDANILASKAKEIGKLIKQVPGVADMKVEATSGQPQIVIHYQRHKLAQYGLNLNDVNNTVQSSLAGAKAGVVFEGAKRFDLVVRMDQHHRNDIADVQNIYLQLESGAQIRLKDIAKITYQPGPMQISRDNTNKRTYVGINIRNRDVKSVVQDITTILDQQLELPPGYYLQYGGAFENMERASARLKLVVPIALLLIFVLIYFALKSVTQTLLIYMAIPLASVGGVMALWLRDMPFSISAGVGFIVLFGVAVLNGLVLISGLNELKAEGVTHLKDRIFEGTKRRIRPIMLTALTDMLGFLPMALSGSAGAEVQQPLATVVIGGLFTSTLLTLFILPILYQWVEQNQQKISFKMKPKSVLATVVFLFLAIPHAQSQNQEPWPAISLQEAVLLSKANYPLLKQKQLELSKSKDIKNTTFDMGTTRIFTGGEEIKDGEGIYTLVGFGQSNIDVFGINSKNKLQNARIQLADKALKLSKLEVEVEVKTAWANAYKAKNKSALYKALDSIYQQFKTAAKLHYEVESISKLEFNAAQNQAYQIELKKNEAYSDYLIELQKLNLWLMSDQFYEVGDIGVIHSEIIIDSLKQNHPALTIMQDQMEEADANFRSAKALKYPKLNIQGGLQQVHGENGFYTYQAGLSIPLLSGLNRAKVKSARIDKDIAETNVHWQKKQINWAFNQAQSNFIKWQNSWEHYQSNVLPLTLQQRNGALLAYQLGEIGYTEFSQLLKEATQLELESQEAYYNYLISLFKLQYFQ